MTDGHDRSHYFAPLTRSVTNCRSFHPDLVLVRQHARDASDNWKHVVVALHYGGVPAINSLHSVYNFLDKPWVVSATASSSRHRI